VSAFYPLTKAYSMMKIIFLILLTLTTSALLTSCEPECPEGTTRDEYGCYTGDTTPEG